LHQSTTHLPQVDWKAHGSYRLKGFADPQAVYEPYNKMLTTPLAVLSGQKVPVTEEVGYCKLCGRVVKLTETFKCRTCGTEGICTAYCLHQAQQQCLECASKASQSITRMPLKAQELLKLHNLQASFTIRIWTERGEKPGSKRNILVVPKKEFGQYNIGDHVTAYFQSATDAYVYIFNIGPTGDVTQIFPNDYTTDNHVKGGKQYTFPDENATFEWILQEPTGVEIIKVIATKVPVGIEAFLAEEFSKPATRDIGVKPRAVKTLSADQWVAASCTLLVQK
jgi:hypothetical protein